MVTVRQYQAEDAKQWNRLVATSKNGTFLFDRGFMDYHADRFEDHSLLFFEGESLLAVLPANQSGETLYSHQGLTYGGIVCDRRLKASDMLSVFEAMTAHARQEGRRRIIYKRVPYIYHTLPADEDLYALFRCGAQLMARGISSAVSSGNRLAFNSGRRWRIRKSQGTGVVGESTDFERFVQLVAARLEQKYDTRPVHTAPELRLLASRFPEQIKLYSWELGGRMEAGVLMFDTGRVAHTQYITSTEVGRQHSAPDVILDHLINERYRDTPYFDFGISTEAGGAVLNEGLIRQKEELGGRGLAYDIYEIAL